MDTVCFAFPTIPTTLFCARGRFCFFPARRRALFGLSAPLSPALWRRPLNAAVERTTRGLFPARPPVFERVLCPPPTRSSACCRPGNRGGSRPRILRSRESATCHSVRPSRGRSGFRPSGALLDLSSGGPTRMSYCYYYLYSLGPPLPICLVCVVHHVHSYTFNHIRLTPYRLVQNPHTDVR